MMKKLVPAAVCLLFGLLVAAMISHHVKMEREQEQVAKVQEQAAARKAQAAAQAKVVADCLASRDKVLASYSAHMERREFDAAQRVLQPCAKAQPDSDFRRLIADADYLDLQASLQDKSVSARQRVMVLDMMKSRHPARYGDRERQMYSRLEAQIAAEDSAERRSKGVSIGMTQAEVLQSSWGRPQKVNRTTYAWGVKEQWVYGSGNYLYFTDGKLDAISN